MSSIDEKRVHGSRGADVDRAYLASGDGLVRIRIAGGTVGEFTLVHRAPCVDVATAGDRVAVATADGVLEGPPGELTVTETDGVDAIGYDGRTLVTATADGGLRRRPPAGTWTRCGRVDPPVRAIDGPFVGGAGGVFRLEDGPTPIGLSGVRDLVATPRPRAATDAGVSVLEEGWREELAEPARRIAAGPAGVAVLTAGGAVVGPDGQDDPRAVPGVDPVDVGVGRGVVLATADGRVLTPDGDGWRERSMGVRDVGAVAVVDPDRGAKTG